MLPTTVAPPEANAEAEAAPEPWTSPSRAADPADPRWRKRIAPAVAAEAVLLGFAGDGLLKAPGLGINLFIWTACALVAFVSLARRRSEGEHARQWAFTVPVLFFAGVFAYRDAGALLALNVLALLSAFGMLAIVFLGNPGDVRTASVVAYIESAVGIGLSGVFGGASLLTSDGALRGTAPKTRRGAVLASVRGLALAIPVLLVFGSLLSSADARFGRLMSVAFDFDGAAVTRHLFFAGFIAWVTAGYLRGALVASRPFGITSPFPRAQPPTLGIIELGVPLALLNVLFAVFVALQLPYLFGGLAHVQRVAGLTMAEYARHGFFELVGVAALLLPLLLAGSALVQRAEPKQERIFTRLATTMLVLLAIIMVSALQRMHLYTQTFGLTSDRIYATAGMLWLAVVFAIFSVTALRGRHAGFAFGSVIAAWVMLAALDVANPEAMVVRTNVERAARGSQLDAKYVSALSADAVPELVTALHRVDTRTACVISGRLRAHSEQRDTGLPTDWRVWNFSRSRAYRLAHAAIRDTPAGECATPDGGALGVEAAHR